MRLFFVQEHTRINIPFMSTLTTPKLSTIRTSSHRVRYPEKHLFENWWPFSGEKEYEGAGFACKGLGNAYKIIIIIIIMALRAVYIRSQKVSFLYFTPYSLVSLLSDRTSPKYVAIATHSRVLFVRENYNTPSGIPLLFKHNAPFASLKARP